HLTDLQKKFKDSVTVIGVASYERAKTDKEKLDKVEKFVKDQGGKMDYTVAYEGDNQIGAAYMDAANQNGIPYSFVVGGDGKIAWMGYPMDSGFEKAVASAVKQTKTDSKPDATAPTTTKPSDKAPQKKNNGGH